MGKEKVKGMTAKNVEIVLGVLFLLGAVGSFGQGRLYSSEAVWNNLGALFLGAYLLVRGLEWGQLVKLYKSYSTLLAHDPSGSIANIASSTGSTVEAVKRNLRLMIKRGMTDGIVVDEQGNRVVSSLSSPKAGGRQTPDGCVEDVSQVPPSVEMVVTVCAGCGAKNSMPKGANAQCSHCGSQISSIN